MQDIPLKKSLRYRHAQTYKIDDEIKADIELIKAEGYDIGEMGREALRACYSEAKKKIIAKRLKEDKSA